MDGLIARFREWTPGVSDGGSHGRLGLAAGLLTLIGCVVLDVLLSDESAAIAGTYVAAPFVTALLAGPMATTAVGALAIGAAAASPAWNMNTGGPEQAARVSVIMLGACFAVGGAWIRSRSVDRSERLRLLDSVGAVADGSLPLAETLRRVTEVIVPALADICMVDAVHDGRVARIATRVRGSGTDAAIEARMRRRPPALPEWLVKFEPSWRHIPQWWPRIRDEEIRRMASSPDDLEFLASLGLRSSIVIPIRARDRNLGALTLITAWSGRRYGADDVRFGQILTSRIGLALDNAGLFSDLESIERRMDTVMSILDEAIIIHDSDGELVFANPAAARMLGYETTADAIAASATRRRYAIRDEHGNEVAPQELAGRRVLNGQPTGPQVLRATDLETGRERWTRTKARAIEGPAGEVLYSVTAIEDVTDVKRAEFANRLLARTGELVSHSTDYRATLDRVPQLLVPEFADSCSIEMRDDAGYLRRLAIAHRDPERLRLTRELRDRYPVRFDDRDPVAAAISSGEAQLFEITDARLHERAADAEHLRALRGLEQGSVIVAPMMAGGATVGALAFINDRGSRAFDREDLGIAVEIARRVALAIEHARIADERAKIADALQRELLPPSLPRTPGWEVSTMYEPAGEMNEVGGDFYEVFPVEGGWAVVLGDVSGKGAAAAALTAEARYTIRTAGALAADPVRGLHMLDHNLRGRDDVALCSVVMLVLPESDGSEISSEVRIYLAGHPHPMLLRSGSAEQVGEPGPLLGMVENPSWEPVVVSLTPGDQLVLYTDGVIEARREDGERFGSDRLRVVLAGCASPDLAVDAVREALSAFGVRTREDDAALVAIRRSGPSGQLTARHTAAALSGRSSG